MSQPAYNLRTIRKLLTAAFSDEALRQLCFDVPEFKPVYEQFSTGMSKDQVIQRLIEYCERKVLTGRLLEIIEEEAPEQYALFADNLIVGGKKAEPASMPNPVAMPNETEFLQQLLTQKTRELYDLKLKAAQFGALHTPPYITLRIEDLEKEIDELKQKSHLKR